MDPLHVAHLVLVSLWGGLVLGEVVLELGARREARLVANVHFWMDLFAELPLLAGVLTTGAWLTARAWPPPPLLAVKIGAGLVAVALNLYCVCIVVLRRRQRDDANALAHYGRRVLISGAGVPFALTAAYLGLLYFRR